MDKPAMRMNEEDKRTGAGLGGFVRPSAWRTWIGPLVIGAVGFAVVHPFDGSLSHAASRFAAGLSGDIKRELFAWQQYGQGLATVVIALAIWLADPSRRRRLLDLLLVVIVAEIVAHGGKLLVGRPRPRREFDDPRSFLGPWGEYPILVDGKPRLVHAWDIAGGASTDLWSMPSSHTLFAAALSAFIAALYPRLRWLVAGLTVLVAFGRVLFDAHWPTDVIVGGCAGYAIGTAVTRNYAGVRVVDWVWRRVVDRSATPALPGVLAEEKSRAGRERGGA